MKQVSRNEFFAAVAASTRDIHPSIVSAKYPYTSEWKFHRELGQPLFGKSVGRKDGGHDYFLAGRD